MTTMMKNIKSYVLLLATISMLWSCTDKFEEFNKNPYGVTDADLNPDFALVPASLREAQLNIYVTNPAWVTQLQQNLIADVYSGYMMPPTPFRGNSNNTNYDLVDGWNEQGFIPAYNSVMNPISKVEASTKESPTTQDLYAMAKIIKVEAMHRVSDIYGPIIYSKYKTPGTDGYYDYDSQEEAYNAFFADLKTAIDILTPLSGSASSKLFKDADLVYGGSYEKWVRFANTLRLRLAIRISKVNPTKAKSEGEAALGNAVGLLTTNSHNFLIDIGAVNHPLNVFNNEWGDIRMGAPMESILGGYDDPRLPNYFQPATDAAVAGQFKGIRNGINIDAKSRYENYSKLTTFANKIQLMTAAEAWFLKTEAALYSWTNAGDEQVNYETGIQTSFDQYGLGSASAYYNDAVSTAKPYVDPKSITPGANNVSAGPNLSTITIAWDDADTDAENLERIITQKWISMYPDGQEAWSEFRRTGYPKLFPVVINNSNGKIPNGEFIKRINFVQPEYTRNKPAVERAILLLDGEDNGGTALWWDVD
jgi:hypothetical protein